MAEVHIKDSDFAPLKGTVVVVTGTHPTSQSQPTINQALTDPSQAAPQASASLPSSSYSLKARL